MGHARRSWLRDNGLTIALLSFFAASFAGHILAGNAAESAERALQGEAALGLGSYITSASFLSSVFENWESEFLQMAAYVTLTAYLFQRGSPESRDPDDDTVRPGEGKDRPRGLLGTLYAHSLGLTLFGLFVISFVFHWINSAQDAAEEAIAHGQPPPGVLGHLVNPQLWFESFQNWQSEFLSTAVLVVLGIFLRERLSPESKAVGDPNGKTGAD